MKDGPPKFHFILSADLSFTVETGRMSKCKFDWDSEVVVMDAIDNLDARLR